MELETELVKKTINELEEFGIDYDKVYFNGVDENIVVIKTVGNHLDLNDLKAIQNELGFRNVRFDTWDINHDEENSMFCILVWSKK